jgi:hypothetical protein
MACALLNSKSAEGYHKGKENIKFIRVLSSVGEGIHLDYENIKPDLVQNKQQCPKLNGKSDYCDIYLN